MIPTNPVIKLCMAGTLAEFHGQMEQAHGRCRPAWKTARDDDEAYVAAHYVARGQADPLEELRWNRIAPDKADAVADDWSAAPTRRASRGWEKPTNA